MKNYRHYLLVTVLLIMAAWVWFQGRSIVKTNMDEKIDAKAGTLNGRASGVKMIQIPVMVKKIAPAPRVKAKQKITDNKETQSKKTNKGVSTGNGKSSGGAEPNLFARYEVPVEDYLRYMRARGSKVLVYSKTEAKVVCEILEGGVVATASGINHLSSRSRRITDDFPNRNKLLEKVTSRFGQDSYEIVLLLPYELEDSIYGNITRIIEGKGLKRDDIITVFMIYRGNGSSISVYIEKVSGKFGVSAIGETFRL